MIAGLAWVVVAPVFYLLLKSLHDPEMDLGQSWQVVVLGLIYLPIGWIYGLVLGAVVGTLVGIAFKLGGATAGMLTAPIVPIGIMSASYRSWKLILDTNSGWDYFTSTDALNFMFVLGPVLSAFLLTRSHIKALQAENNATPK